MLKAVKGPDHFPGRMPWRNARIQYRAFLQGILPFIITA